MVETYHFQTEDYKNKVNFAKKFISSNIDMNIEELLIKKEWDEETSLCMHIFNDEVTNEDEEYIKSLLETAYHRRDKRTSLEYACDLMVGWILEDCIVEMLNMEGYETILNSADSDRKILTKPKADSDLRVMVDGEEVLIELVNDFKGYWKRYHKVDLRDNKYENLKDENSLLLGIDFKYSDFFILDISKTEARYIPFHYPFRKPAYSLKLKETDFYSLDNASNALSNALKNSAKNL